MNTHPDRATTDGGTITAPSARIRKPRLAAAVLGALALMASLALVTPGPAAAAPGTPTLQMSTQQRPGDSVDVRQILQDTRARTADDVSFAKFLHDQFGADIPADAVLTGTRLYRLDATSPSWGDVSPDRYTNFTAIVGIAWDHADGSPGRNDVIYLHYQRTQFVEATIETDTLWGSDEVLDQTPTLTLAQALAAFHDYRDIHGERQGAVDFATLRIPQTTQNTLYWMFASQGGYYFVDATTGEVVTDTSPQ